MAGTLNFTFNFPSDYMNNDITADFMKFIMEVGNEHRYKFHCIKFMLKIMIISVA
jgi:hypothetical protein